MAKRKRTRQRLEPHECDSARVLLADGVPADVVAERLGVDVRALADLLDDVAARELSDLDRALIGYRNAVFLYECERDRVLRFQRLVPGDIPSNGQRDKAIRYLERTERHADAARKHLETVHKWAETLAKLGGSVSANGTVVEIPVPGGLERGDLDAERDGYSADDDADQ